MCIKNFRYIDSVKRVTNIRKDNKIFSGRHIQFVCTSVKEIFALICLTYIIP